MEPGCYLLLAGREPPILATITAIGTSQIEYEQFDDDRLAGRNTFGNFSPADFVDIGTYEQRQVFGFLSKDQNLQKLQQSLQQFKNGLLEKKLSNLLNDALILPFQKSTLIAPGKPEVEDLRLANEWMKGQTAGSTSEETRMVSARMAEKAVMKYFLDRGAKPKDIAVLQLPEYTSRDCEWKSYDIRVGDACIDVKNARRSEQNFHAFVSHCVPQFKNTRDGSSVIVAGALSKWLCLDDIKNGDSEVRFLGTTSAEKISQLREMLTSSRLQISDTPLNAPKFLPSWIFDYSSGDYKFRDEALSEASEYLRNLPIKSDFDDSGMGIMPALLALGATDLIDPISTNDTWNPGFISCLDERLKKHPHNLSVVFLTILDHFLSMLAADDPRGFSPHGYRDIIFYSLNWESPVFLCDPERAVYSLIECLETLWHHRDESLLSLNIFRLHHLNRLSGRRDEHSPWQTVLAYCGGWKTESGRSTRPCGMTPLVYGKHESCSCGKLICPKCGFCSKDEDCPECKPRQSKLEALRNSLSKSNSTRTQ